MKRRPASVFVLALVIAAFVAMGWAASARGPSKAAEPGTTATAAEQALIRRAVVPFLVADGPADSPPQSLTIQFLDVGQGDAILVTINGHRLLVDGGPSRERLHARLQSLGVTDIDAILVTNPDADHIRGLIEALAMFQVKTFYSSASTNPSDVYTELLGAVAAEPGIRVISLLRGATVSLGGVQLNVLHPLEISGDRNNDSIALRLTCGFVSVLLMGDATTASEASMLAAGLVSKVDVVKAGHHGSRTSSGDAFVNMAKPNFVVFSAGRDSQFGHPHAEVVARYLTAGAKAVYTDTTEADDTPVMTSDCRTYSFSVPTASSFTVTPGPTGPATTATSTPAPSATATPGVTCGDGTATITGLDKVGEFVTLSASGNLTGWRLVSVTGSQTFNFPTGFVGSGTVQVKSAAPVFANTLSLLWWSTANVWSDSGNDDAALYNCNGDLVQTFDDGQ